MDRETTATIDARRRVHGDTHSSWVTDYLPMILGGLSLLVIETVGHDWLKAPTPASAALILAWLFAVILWGAIGVMHHAERIAHLLGEPLGTLVLTLSAILIEVSLIASVMLVGEANPTLARDTMYAVLMLILNGFLGASLLAGGLRHRQQDYNLEGARAFLVVLMPLAALALLLPNYTTSTADPTLSPGQSAFFGITTLALYGVFLAIQTRRHRAFFEEVGTQLRDPHTAEIVVHGPAGRTLLSSGILLVLTLLPIALLSHHLAGIVEFGIGQLGAPDELAGVLIAALILAPEGITAFRAAWHNHLQRSVNIMLGSALSTIGLTVPTVLMIGIALNTELVLGLDPKHAFLLVLTLLVSTLTFSGSRTDMLKGAVHFVLFLMFIMLILMP
jgi:Ca2+:H+ antiporter